jgi:hypothetical protein
LDVGWDCPKALSVLATSFGFMSLTWGLLIQCFFQNTAKENASMCNPWMWSNNNYKKSCSFLGFLKNVKRTCFVPIIVNLFFFVGG